MTCKKLQARLASEIHRRTTKPRGFRKKGLAARRFIPGEPFGVLHVLFVQGSSGNVGSDCGAYINVGATFVMPEADPESVTVHECVLGCRVAKPNDRWSLSDASLNRIASVVDEQAGPWFDERNDPVETFRRAEREYVGRPTAEWVGLVDEMCRCWVALGEPERAATTLRDKLDFLQKERPHALPQRVHDFAASLGLEL